MDVNSTKKCHSCGADIPRDADFCDICGAPVSVKDTLKAKAAKSEGKKPKMSVLGKSCLIAALCFVGVIVILLILGAILSRQSMRDYEEYRKLIDLSDWEETVTAEEFEKIKPGMTYEEVKEIIGGDGKLIEDDKYRTTYRWPGEYYVDMYFGYLELDFSKISYEEPKDKVPKLESMNEHEIVNGAECMETYKLMDKGLYADLETEYVTKAQASQIEAGMTFEEVCELLGTEGKHHRSRSYTYSNRKDLHDEYVWRCRQDGRYDVFTQTFEDGVVKELPEWELEHMD